MTTVLPPVAALELTYRCNHSPVEILRWNEWERLPESEEWMHFIRHDYLPEMCTDCARAAKCMGGCREAARVFLGSPSAPDPLLANGVERETGFS